ncbi:hypothetical protein [Sodalis sp. C49]|uniref:hypothetical protein n=1 Tax=unclassified Sodalis (in: enterobacteria) TaxID=2636512 RepID=UPI003965BE9E
MNSSIINGSEVSRLPVAIQKSSISRPQPSQAQPVSYADKEISPNVKDLKEPLATKRRKFTKSPNAPTRKHSQSLIDEDIAQIAFNYTNSKGEYSFREVDVKKFDGYYLEGYCHKARRFRTFIIDSIEDEVIIRSTGEAMSTDEWAERMTLAVA